MAKLTLKADGGYIEMLAALADEADDAAKAAVRAGGAVLADAVRASLEALPEDTHTVPGQRYYYLTESEKYNGVPAAEKASMLDALGVTPPKLDRDGNWNVKVGFDGYDDTLTLAYPTGRPIPMLANAVEHGSSVRPATPFIKPAAQRANAAAVQAMQDALTAAYDKKTGGNANA